MKVRTAEELYNENIRTAPISFDEFARVVNVGGKSIDDYLAGAKFRGAGTDPRLEDDFIQNLYDFYIGGHKEFCVKYFSGIGKAKLERPSIDISKFNSALEEHGFIDCTIGGKNGTRLIKNVFFENIYNTPKAHGGHGTVLNALKNLTSGTFVTRHFVIPSNYMSAKIKDYTKIPLLLNTAFDRASIFPVDGYTYIIDNYLGAKKILIPAGSWGSPALAFAGANGIEEMHIIDVIPEVLEKTKKLFSSTTNFFDQHKTLITHCCPSQHIDEREGFTDTHNDFDTVFFSPPYYDVEQYIGGEQSWEEYPTYQSWLDGYWRGTVEMCSRALKSGGKFTFAIFNYKDKGGNLVTISEDMRDIAKEYFDFDKTIGICHSKGVNGSSADKTRNGIVEDFHIFTKK